MKINQWVLIIISVLIVSNIVSFSIIIPMLMNQQKDNRINHDDHQHNPGEKDNNYGDQDKDHGHSDGDDELNHDDHGSTGQLNFNDEQIKEYAISLEKAGPKTLVKTIRLTGRVGFNEDKLYHVIGRTKGVVKEVYRSKGDEVRQGESLAAIESMEAPYLIKDFNSTQGDLHLLDNKRRYLSRVSSDLERLVDRLSTYPEIDDLGNIYYQLAFDSQMDKILGAYIKMQHQKKVFEREEKLYKDGITSMEEYEHAEHDYLTTKTQYQTAVNEALFQIDQDIKGINLQMKTIKDEQRAVANELQLIGIIETRVADGNDLRLKNSPLVELSSPSSGVIIEQHLANGEKVEANDPLLSIADLSSLWIEFNIYQDQHHRVSKNQEIRIYSNAETLPIVAKIDKISPTVDAHTNSATARVVINNAQSLLKPGQYVTGQLVYDSFTVPMAVKKTAIQRFEEKEEDIIFVRNEKGFEKRVVTKKRMDNDYVEVTSGLKDGEVYAANKSLLLKSDMMKAHFGHGHAH